MKDWRISEMFKRMQDCSWQPQEVISYTFQERDLSGQVRIERMKMVHYAFGPEKSMPVLNVRHLVRGGMEEL